MSKKKIFLTRKNQGLIKRLVLLDGFSGSGKSLLGAVLSHLAKSEQWQIDYFYEQIAILNYLHKIPFKSIKALCEVKSSETLYNLFIGRNVNFRPTDDSSPLKNGLRKKYIKRLKNKDKNFALKDILNSNPILILHLHYIFGYSKMLMKVFQKNLSLYILMLRNPFYLIDYWYSRKFTSVVGKSKIDFGMCVEAKGKVIPWYTTEYSSLYLKANNLEKSILTIFEMYKRISNMSNKLNAKEKKKLQVVFFEDFLINSNDYLNLICKKLKCKTDKKFNIISKKIILESKNKETNMKIMNINVFQKKYSTNISPKYKKKLYELDILYRNLYSKNKIN